MSPTVRLNGEPIEVQSFQIDRDYVDVTTLGGANTFIPLAPQITAEYTGMLTEHGIAQLFTADGERSVTFWAPRRFRRWRRWIYEHGLRPWPEYKLADGTVDEARYEKNALVNVARLRMRSVAIYTEPLGRWDAFVARVRGWQRRIARLQGRWYAWQHRAEIEGERAYYDAMERSEYAGLEDDDE